MGVRAVGGWIGGCEGGGWVDWWMGGLHGWMMEGEETQGKRLDDKEGIRTGW